jgi:hypothetical protein
MIQRLQNRITEVTAMTEQEQRALAADPDNLALQLSLDSLTEHLSDLQHQLMQEKALREKEVVEIRLKGAKAREGSIPLGILGHIARNLSGGVYAASQLIRSGKELLGRVPPELEKTLDLRLAGLSFGSTRLFITGNNAPDLFGHSLLEDSLESTFGLLNANNPDDLTQTASQIGRRSIHRFNTFLKTLAAADLEAEISWSSPTNRTYTWQGGTEIILRLTNSLDSLTVTQPEILTVTGVLVMLNIRGSFEIMQEEGPAIKGKLPLQLLEQTRQVHVGDVVTAEVEEKTIINQTTGFAKAYYTLVSIRPTDHSTLGMSQSG